MAEEFGYNSVKYKQMGRLVYVDPNDLASLRGYSDTNIKDNVYWNPEDLNINVDLQVIVPNRDDLMQCNYDSDIFNVTLSTNSQNKQIWTTFFGGKKLSEESGTEYLTDSYTDMSYTELRKGSVSDKESLGIESVDITFDSHFYPQVSIKFIDVHGYSLMNPAEFETSTEGKSKGYQGFFKSLFHFPYPRFLLTIKGQFGSRVTFTLAVNEFKGGFNAQTGNFEITVTFIGYMYGLYTDIPLNFLLVAPYLDTDFGAKQRLEHKNSKWDEMVSSGKFVVKENGGVPLKTFIDFVNDYYKLDEKIAQASNRLNGESALVKMNNNSKSVATLTDLKNNFCTMLKEMAGNTGGVFTTMQIIDSDEKFDSINGKVLIAQNGVETTENGTDKRIIKYTSFQNYYEKCVNNIKNLNNDTYGGEFKLPEAGDDYTKLMHDIEVKKIPVNATIVDGEVVKGNDSTPTEASENNTNYDFSAFENVINNDDYIRHFIDKYQYGYVIDVGNYLQKIKDKISELNTANENLDEVSMKEEQDITSELLGYRPTLENIFRMIFAHLDIFIYFFYENVINPIAQSSRHISDFPGLNTADLDLGTKRNTLFLPPFPATYKNKDGNRGKRTLVYPSQIGDGTVFNSTNMVELKFVDDLTNAAIQLHRELDVPENTVPDGSKGAEVGNNDVELTYIPLTVSDLYFYLNGTQPYSNCRLSDSSVKQDDENFFLYLLYRAYASILFGSTEETTYGMGYIESNVTSNDSVTFFANVEFYNYLASNKVTDSQIEIFKNNYATEEGLTAIFKSMSANHKGNSRVKTYSGYIDITEQGIFSNSVTVKKGIPDFFSTYDAADPYMKYFVIMDNIGGWDKNYKPLQSDMEALKQGTFLIKTKSDNGGAYYNNLSTIYEKIIKFIEQKNIILDDKSTSYFNHVFGCKLNENTYTIADKSWPGILRKICTNDKSNSYIMECMDNIPNSAYTNCNSTSPEDTYYSDIFNLISSGNYNEYEFSYLAYTDYTGSYLDSDLAKTYPLFSERKKDGSWWQYKIGKRGDEYNKEKEFLFLLACLPFSKSSYETLLNNINKCNKLLKVPLGQLLYIGGLIFATEHLISRINDDYYLMLSYKLNGRDVGEYENYSSKGHIDGDEFCCPLFSLRDTNGFNNISDKTKEHNFWRITNKYKANVLKELFEKYAEEYINIDIDSCMASGEYVTVDDGIKMKSDSLIKMGSALDSFIKKLYLDPCVILNVGKVNNGSTTTTNSGAPSMSAPLYFNGKNYLKAFLESFINQAKASETASETQATQVDDLSCISADNKLATYNSLKLLYDKWLAGYKYDKFKLPTPNERREMVKKRFAGIGEGEDDNEFNNFLFVDSFYNDISNDFYVDLSTVYNAIKDQTSSQNNSSLLEFITQITQENKLLFLALPVFNNFYDGESLCNMFVPHNVYSPAYSKGRSVGSTYLIMYTHEVSHQLEETEEGQYESDGLNLNDDSPLNIFGTTEDGENENFLVPSFAVTFARQNQQYFKNISVNMDNPRVTDYSIANVFQLANVGKDGSSNEPSVTGQDMFSIYSNRSYNCTVEMMGCANIMPMMYFQLNNIPMFRGAYIITNVEHHIEAGDMTTRFTGVRVSKNLIPFTKHLFNVKLFREKALATSSDAFGNTYGSTSHYASGGMVDGSYKDFQKFIQNNILPVHLYRTVFYNPDGTRMSTIPSKRVSAPVVGYMMIGNIKICETFENNYYIRGSHKGEANKKQPEETFETEFVMRHSNWPYGDGSHRALVKEYAQKLTGDGHNVIAIKGQLAGGCLLHPGCDGNPALSETKGWTTGCLLPTNNPEKKFKVDLNNTKEQWKIAATVIYTALVDNLTVKLTIHKYGEEYNGNNGGIIAYDKVERQPSVSGGVGDAPEGSDVNYRNGKIIMNAFKTKFNFNDTVLIGIGSGLYQESHWKTTTHNSCGAAGICQWMSYNYKTESGALKAGGSQKTMVEWAEKEGLGTYHYDNYPNEGKFITIPFDVQLRMALRWLEMRDPICEEKYGEKATDRLKRCSTSEEAAKVWGGKFVEVATTGEYCSAHASHIEIAKKAWGMSV